MLCATARRLYTNRPLAQFSHAFATARMSGYDVSARSPLGGRGTPDPHSA